VIFQSAIIGVASCSKNERHHKIFGTIYAYCRPTHILTDNFYFRSSPMLLYAASAVVGLILSP